jgi:hypothetical protein
VVARPAGSGRCDRQPRGPHHDSVSSTRRAAANQLGRASQLGNGGN